MTPPLLTKVKKLVEAGATVVGPRPRRSPGLTDFPRCDEEVRRVAEELWANCDGKVVKEHRLGKGRVICGESPAEVFASLGVPPDFSARPDRFPDSIRYIHKRLEDIDLYFLANKYPQPVEAVCAFRVQDKRPEFWRPDTGRVESSTVYDQNHEVTLIPIHFDPYGSLFVIFRSANPMEPGRITSVTGDGQPVLETVSRPQQATLARTNEDMASTFTMAVWAKPEIEIDLPPQTNSGISGLHIFRNDALFPPPGPDLYPGMTNAGSGLSVGRNGVCVFEHADGYFAPPLVYAGPLTNWTHIAVVYKDGRPALYLNSKLVHEGMKSHFTVHAGA